MREKQIEDFHCNITILPLTLPWIGPLTDTFLYVLYQIWWKLVSHILTTKLREFLGLERITSDFANLSTQDYTFLSIIISSRVKEIYIFGKLSSVFRKYKNHQNKHISRAAEPDMFLEAALLPDTRVTIQG